MGDWALAQINVARLLAPEGDPSVQPFFDALDAINALAEASPGYLWRLQGESGNATGINPTGDDRLIINMSAWRDPESLFAFVYRSAHTPVMAKRRQWFERPGGAYQALWWVPATAMPSVEDGLARVRHLDRFGPSPHAFTFKTLHPAPDAVRAPELPEAECA